MFAPKHPNNNMKTRQLSNEEKLKLARKYFLEQKAQEIGKFLMWILITSVIVSIIIFFPLFIGKHFDSVCYDNPNDWGNEYSNIVPCNSFGYWSNGLGLIIIFLVILTVIFIIINAIYDWLKSNWIRAKERAGLK